MAESPLSFNAIEYTFRHLLKVAFPQMENEPFRVEKGDGIVIVIVKDVKLVIYAIDQTAFDFFLDGRWWPFVMVDSAKRTHGIPMVFDDDGVDDGVICSDTDSSIHIPYDILTPSFVLLSRYEEFQSKRQDAHGRYPYNRSLAEKYDMVEIPLVDEYAMLLRRWLCQHFPDRFQTVPRTPRIVPIRAPFRNLFDVSISFLSGTMPASRTAAWISPFWSTVSIRALTDASRA